jgi:hypothetical protein
MDNKRFYVYLLCYPNEEKQNSIVECKPFYAGRGTRDRKDCHTQDVRRNLDNPKFFTYGNKHKKNIIKQLLLEGKEPLTVVLKKKLTFEESTQFEVELIKQYGRRDLGTGCLVNLTDGGEGTVNVTSEVVEAKIKRQKKAIIIYDPFTHIRERFDSIPDYLGLDLKKADCWQTRVYYRACRGELIQLKRKLFFYEDKFNADSLKERLEKFSKNHSFGKNKPSHATV